MKWKPSAWLSDALSALLVRAVGIMLAFVSTTVLARAMAPAEYGTYSAALGLAMLLATLAPLGTDRILSQTLACRIKNDDSGCKPGRAKQAPTCSMTVESLEPADARSGLRSPNSQLEADRAPARTMNNDKNERSDDTVPRIGDSAKAIAIAYHCTIMSIGVLLIVLMAFVVAGWFAGVSSEWTAAALSAAIILVPLTLNYLRQWTAMPILGTSRAMMAEQTLLPAAVISIVLISAFFGAKFSVLKTAAIYATISGLIFAGSISSGRLRELHGTAFKLGSGICRGDIFAMLLRGLPLVAVSIGGVASQSTLPMAIAAGCGFENAACFALAIPYATLPAVPLGVLGLSLIPQCARFYASGELAQASHCVRSAATLTFWSAFGIAAGILLISPQLTRILGPQYEAVVDVMPVLLLAVLIDCLTGPTVPVMQTMGLQSFYAKAFFAHWPLQLVLVITFGGTWGLFGAAAGYLVSRALWNLLVVVQIYRFQALLMLPYINPLQALAADQNSFFPSPGVSAKARTA